MRLGKLLSFILSFAGMLALLAGLFALYILRNPPMQHAAYVFIGTCGLACILFFLIQDVILCYPRSQSHPNIKEQELRVRIVNALSSTYKNEKAFDVVNQNDCLIVTYGAGLVYNQVLSIGGRNLKSVFVLRFDSQEQVVRILEKKISWDYSISSQGINFNASFQSGFSLEITRVWQPTIKLDSSGYPVIQLDNHFTFDTLSLFNSLKTIITGNGWDLRVDMLPGLWPRFLFSTVVTLVIGLMAFPIFSVLPEKSKADGSAEAVVVKNPGAGNDYSGIEKTVVNWSTELLEKTILQIISIDRQQIQNSHLLLLDIYVKEYASREDHKASLLKRVQSYKNKISGD